MLYNYATMLNSYNADAYIGYAIGQAKKYGVKGSRLGILKSIQEWLSQRTFDPYTRLQAIVPEILDRFSHESYCFRMIQDSTQEVFLVICGKLHNENIFMDEFIKRINTSYDVYGERAKLAMNNEGIDWKALSHAVRAIQQMEELLTIGYIQYPLVRRNILKCIKNGEYNFHKVERMITEGLETIQELRTKGYVRNRFDQTFVNKLILSFYGIGDV
jgi:hypothetical protein